MCTLGIAENHLKRVDDLPVENTSYPLIYGTPTYFSTSAPTVRGDILNVQADGRLAAHLRETPAPVRAQTLGLYIPDSIKEWLLSGAPRIYDRKDLALPGNRQIALPAILTRYFCSELTIHQFEPLTVAPQKGEDFAPKGGKKGNNQGKDKGGHKGKGKGKGKDQKG